MLNKSKINLSTENNLYNNILFLSRNKMFYTKFNLTDAFQNRIHLIFIHISFLFIKIKNTSKNENYKFFYQDMFDLIFRKIEINMREIGYGDVVINKNMKGLVKSFYNILFNCESYKDKTLESKISFIDSYLDKNANRNNSNNNHIIAYFDKYEAFCFDLSWDSVLKGEINFNYE